MIISSPLLASQNMVYCLAIMLVVILINHQGLTRKCFTFNIIAVLAAIREERRNYEFIWN